MRKRKQALGRLSGTRRLQFDDGLLSELYGTRSVGRGLPWRLLGAGVVCILALIGAVSAGSRFASYFSSGKALAQLCGAVLGALQTNRLEEAINVSAEGEEGRALLAEENRRVLRPEGPAETAPSPTRMSCRDLLQMMRDNLAEKGVAWGETVPLAFGGVQAKVLDRERMRKPVVSVTGDLYFLSGDTVYALEMTARRCKGGCVVTDFWKCAATEARPEDLQDYARARFEAMLSSGDGAEASAEIGNPRRVFVELETMSY